jgi:hypothetical protein
MTRFFSKFSIVWQKTSHMRLPCHGTPRPELDGNWIKVIHDPFFSYLSYPAEDLHSLAYVCYKPYESWTDKIRTGAPRILSPDQLPQFRAAHMIRDGQRYLPSLAHARYEKHLFEVKTVLVKTDYYDGRPILYQQKPINCRFVSIIGGKIDNIYDLLGLTRTSNPEFVGLIYFLLIEKRG